MRYPALLFCCYMVAFPAGIQTGFGMPPGTGQPAQGHPNPLFIYFTADHCGQCAAYDKIFNQESTRAQIEEHYVAVYLNIDHAEGKACADIYAIHDAPAVVVADQGGTILYRSSNFAEDIGSLMSSILGNTGVGTEKNPGQHSPIEVTQIGTFKIPRIDEIYPVDALHAISEGLPDAKPLLQAPAPVHEGRMTLMPPVSDAAPVLFVSEKATTPNDNPEKRGVSPTCRYCDR